MAKAFDHIAPIESSQKITVVHLYAVLNQEQVDEIEKSLKIIEELHPDLKIDFLSREGQFGPKTVDALSKELQMPHNNIFIRAPEEKHRFSVEDLGGVRVIF